MGVEENEPYPNGVMAANAADSIPGRTLRRSMSSSSKTLARGRSYQAASRGTPVATTLVVENPGFVVRIFRRLSSNRAAPTSKMKLRHTWKTTKLERIQVLPRAPTTPTDSDFKGPARSSLRV